ncbi:Desiccation-related protein PCC13-62 [Rhynchospora pubera]|uniref:Desiccation-related protein PCC13-62 n=1 Tax=Rhynchospora pubera TaxID=906938 RepID=A0AAV8DP48_9POAL|nr:Desiccation-related protein PCC13-62 [Rhynchospora pubera]
MLTYLTSAIFTSLLLLLVSTKSKGDEVLVIPNPSLSPSDIDLLEFPLNLEYLEAEFFLWGSLGYGLDMVAPNLTAGGPPPIGGKKANLDPVTRDIILQFAYQEVGHLRAMHKENYCYIRRPFLSLSEPQIAAALERKIRPCEAATHGFHLTFSSPSHVLRNLYCQYPLYPPFDPYTNGLNFLIASYIIPYVGLTGYVGANPKLQSAQAKRLVAGLLGVESAQDAVIRALLHERASLKVQPYDITVAELTNRISDLRNDIGKQGLKNEGLIVPLELGAEGRISGNVIAGDRDSVAYDR